MREIFYLSQRFIVNSSWGSSVGKTRATLHQQVVLRESESSAQNLFKPCLCTTSPVSQNGKMLFISRFMEENGGSSLETALIKHPLESQINPKIINKAPGWCQGRLFIIKGTNDIRTPVLCAVILLLGVDCDFVLSRDMQDATGYAVLMVYMTGSLHCSLDLVHSFFDFWQS